MVRLPASTTARARCARSVLNSSSSRSVVRPVVPSTTTMPASSATLLTPAAMVEKYGSEMSCTSRPTSTLALRASACAEALGR